MWSVYQIRNVCIKFHVYVEWPPGAGCGVVFGAMLWSSFQHMMLLPMYNGKIEWPTRASCFYLCFILS
jgi:hypothetical protein